LPPLPSPLPPSPIVVLLVSNGEKKGDWMTSFAVTISGFFENGEAKGDDYNIVSILLIH